MKAADLKLVGGRARLVLVTALLMTGCAGYQLHRDGMKAVKAGHPQEGLTNLADASRVAPRNLPYRADLLRSREQTVNSLLAAANSERVGGRHDAAQAIYEQVLLIEPGNSRAALGLESVAMDRRHDLAMDEADALIKGQQLEAAQDALKPVLLENPQNRRLVLLQRQIDEERASRTRAAPVLKAAFTKPVSLQFRDANLKMVFEALSRTSGINILLDRDVKSDLQTSIFVKDVSVEDTINLILLQNQLEKKVLSDNTVFIYPGTPAKLKDYQDLKIRSFHLTHADPKQMLTMIKTLLKTKDIFIHEQTNSIVMRDTPDAIRLAERMIADQDIEEPEVMLEVEVLEVSRTKLSELGIRWPDTFSLSTPDSVETLGDLKDLATNSLRASRLSATLRASLEQGNSNLLASPRIRVRNREKAKIMVGSRVPVITNTITPMSTGAAVVTGTVEYLDVGLQLEVEPNILLNNEVVIKLGMDVSSIIGTIDGPEGSRAYEVGTRNASTVLRLKDGETQILGGLINDEDRRFANKVPLLGQIPLLGRLFSVHNTDKLKTEIVLSITPHIVGSAAPRDAEDLEYWTGTESNLRSAQFNLTPLGKVAVSASAATTPVARARLPQAPPTPQGAPASGPVVLSWAGPTQVNPGETVSLTLNLQSLQPVSRVDLQVGFDASVFKAVDVVEGGFLKQDDKQSVMNKSIDQAGGQIMVDVMAAGSEGTSGAGGLVTFVFQALTANPQSQIVVSRLSASGPGGEGLALIAPDPYAITVGPLPGTTP